MTFCYHQVLKGKMFILVREWGNDSKWIEFARESQVINETKPF